MYSDRLLVLLGFLALGCTVDHNVFKSCSQNDLCSQYRERSSQLVYVVNSTEMKASDGQMIFHLESLAEGYDHLTMTITALGGEKFRLNIDERIPFRYKLKDVLVSEPVGVPFDSYGNDRDIIYAAVGNSRAQVEVRDNFTVTFSYKGNKQVVLNSDRLLLEPKTNGGSPFTLGLYFPNSRRLYGLHEHADHLALQNTRPNGPDPYRLRNLDVPGYELDSTMALYGMVPVLYAHGVYSTSGLFLLNAAEQWVETTSGTADNTSTVNFIVGSGALDLFVLLGPTPTDVVRQYASLTGVAHLPPIWSLGYHQCRWGYYTQEEIIDIVAKFDENSLPLDTIWLDITYTDGYRYFTWEPKNFSDPIGMLDQLDSTNRKLVAISDPHIKTDPNYFVYREALEKDLFVKTAQGRNFEGDCWPGTSSWLDYLNPAAREFYADLYSYDSWVSTPTLAGIWNDMNEPSVFDDSLEKTMPNDALHYGGVIHRDVHGIYGFLQTMATHQGLLKRDNNQARPFILTRSHFAGTQRYSAIWTGDNAADWGNIASSWSMCLNANILGLSFCGADVGGFFGNPDEELVQRFYQSGAWLPFYRAHSNIDTERREPYLYSPLVQDVIRSALHLRYIHLLYWYTLFYEHTRNGDPVIRPLFYQYPQDLNVLDIDDQLLVGTDILVRQVNQPGVTAVDVYFPGGSDQLWYSMDPSGRVYEGGQSVAIPVTIKYIPFYYRGGSIVAVKETAKTNTVDTLATSTVLYVSLDKNNEASGTVYLDDYISFKYRDSDDYNYVKLSVADCKEQVKSCRLQIESVDDSNSDNFQFDFAAVVYQYKDESGQLVREKHINDEDGLSLSGFKFSGRKKIEIRTVASLSKV